MKSAISDILIWGAVASSVAASFGQHQRQNFEESDCDHKSKSLGKGASGYASQSDANDPHDAYFYRNGRPFGHGDDSYRDHDGVQMHSDHGASYNDGLNREEVHPQYDEENYGSIGSGSSYAGPVPDTFDHGDNGLGDNGHDNTGVMEPYPYPQATGLQNEPSVTASFETVSSPTGSISLGPEETSTEIGSISQSLGPTGSTSADTETISPGPDSTLTTPTPAASDNPSSTASAAPVFTEILCPDVDLQCVDNFYVGCSKRFNQINRAQVSITRIRNVADARICHQRCVDDPTCTAWEDVDIPLGQRGVCYHHHEAITLNITVPYVAATLGVSSFGVRNYCQLSPGPLAPIQPPFASATTNLVTIPASPTSDLCPDFDGRCLNDLAVHCDRSLLADATAQPGFNTTDRPDLTTQRECHEACAADITCQGWMMSPESSNTGVSRTTTCSLVGNGIIQLLNPPPAASPEYVGYSYGVKRGCPKTDDDLLCDPGQCTDSTRIQCRRNLGYDAATGLSDAVGANTVDSALACHQACAEDATCRAWYGSFQDSEVGDGIFVTFFSCYRLLSRAVTLRSDRPAGPPNTIGTDYYGIKGLC